MPLDASFPVERLRYIIGDAEISAIVSMASLRSASQRSKFEKILLDQAKRAIDAEPSGPVTGIAPTFDPLCSSSTHPAQQEIRRALPSRMRAFAISSRVAAEFVRL